jgi:DMSO/TMAO reductase YedYZ molybdopterin-dependent catalytic subunit
MGSWKLIVDGKVDQPRPLTVRKLRKLPMTEVTCVLQRAGNGRNQYAPSVPGVQ